MEDRRIFSYLEINSASLPFPRTLGDNLEPKLSLIERQESIDAFFIPWQLKNLLSSISHHVF